MNLTFQAMSVTSVAGTDGGSKFLPLYFNIPFSSRFTKKYITKYAASAIKIKLYLYAHHPRTGLYTSHHMTQPLCIQP
jgi:hypothetical protein